MSTVSVPSSAGPASERPAPSHTPAVGHRSPRTIWWMLSRELFSLLIVAGTTLVAVIAFGLTMQPLAAGRVNVGDAIRFAAFLTVPMLQYAMPFAGAFAATLTYHRFASEREAVACAASGIPYRQMLAPALLLGSLLGLSMFSLGIEVIPRFLRSAESLIARDVGSMIITPLRLGRTVQVGEMDIRANEVISLGPSPELGITQHLAMFDVFATRVNAAGTSDMFVSAERVDLWVYESEESQSARSAQGSAALITEEGFVAGPTSVAVLQLAFTNASGQMPDGAVTGETLVLNPVRVPTTLSDRVKFLTWRAMDRALAEPRRMNRIDEESRKLAAMLAQRAAQDIIGDELATQGTITLRRYERETLTIGTFDSLNRPIPAGLELRADPALPSGAWLIPTTAAPITIIWREGDIERRVQRPAAARLSLNALDPRTNEPLGYLEARLEMEGVSTITGSVNPAVGGERASLRIGALRLMNDPYPSLARQPAEVLIQRAESAIELAMPAADQANPASAAVTAASASVSDITKASRDLRERIDKFRREVVSKRNEHAAFAVVTCLMTLLGSILALRLANSLPLAVYLCSFLPALGAVILISVGERLAYRHGPLVGLPVLWSSAVGLALYALIELRRVGRH